MVTLLLLLFVHYLVLADAAFVGTLPSHYDYRGGVPGIGRDVNMGTDSMMGNVPVGVGADYAYFASQMGQNPLELYGLYTAPLSGYQAGLGMNGNSGSSLPQTAGPPYMGQSALLTTVRSIRQNADIATNERSQSRGDSLVLTHAPPPETTAFPMELPSPPTPPLIQPSPPPEPQQQAMTNMFIAGVNKAADFKQFFFPDSSGSPDKARGQHPIPGLTAPAKEPAPVVTANSPRRAPCDPLVDVVFALDDIRTLWMARDAIRNYVTQLRPQGKVRFGVVLCGEQLSFYTVLHQHFSGLLASLEDLQHANVTLDVTQHMPDTPGTRADNNPYPPSVSEDFAQTTAGCLETAYFMFMYQSKDHVERQLTVVATRERWGVGPKLEEARYLQSLNISMLILADGKLTTRARDTLRDMALTPDRYRIISDSVTMHALPAIIGDAICRPQKADVTVSIERTSTTVLQNFRVLDCYQVNSTALERTLDFGHHFGQQVEVIFCSPGMTPDPARCQCVGL